MAVQLQMVPGQCRSLHSQASSSGRQVLSGACPLAPPCKLGCPSASLHFSSPRTALVARRPLRPAALAPHLQQWCQPCGRKQRPQHSRAARCSGAGGVLDHEQVRWMAGVTADAPERSQIICQAQLSHASLHSACILTYVVLLSTTVSQHSLLTGSSAALPGWS